MDSGMPADHRLDPQPAIMQPAVPRRAEMELEEVLEVCLREPRQTTLTTLYRSPNFAQRPGRIPRLRAMEIPP